MLSHNRWWRAFAISNLSLIIGLCERNVKTNIKKCNDGIRNNNAQMGEYGDKHKKTEGKAGIRNYNSNMIKSRFTKEKKRTILKLEKERECMWEV